MKSLACVGNVLIFDKCLVISPNNHFEISNSVHKFDWKHGKMADDMELRGYYEINVLRKKIRL